MKNLKVIYKLTLSFAIILTLFVVASAIFTSNNKNIMTDFSYFYDHPFKVIDTTHDLKIEISSMRILIKDSILKNDPNDALETINEINTNKVAGYIQVLKETYLGDQADIDAFEEKYQQWLLISIKALEGARGGFSDATNLSIDTATVSADEVMAQLDKIITYANGKADSFYQDASETHHLMAVRGIIYLLLVVLASVILIYILARNINSPLSEMLLVIKAVEMGKEATCENKSARKDELGRVMDAFNGMLVHLKTEKELSELKMTLEHQKTLEQFRVTLLSIGDAVISTDIKGNIVNMNAVAERLTGWLLSEAKGKPAIDVFHIINAQTLQEAENPLEKVLNLGMVVGLANHTVLISKNGKRYHIADSAAPIRDDQDVMTGVVLVFRDVTEDYRKQEEILHMSTHDKLTGLYNRDYFESELERNNEEGQLPFSIIMGDINGLKLINDTCGHFEGDRYLLAASIILKSCCGENAVVSRWGGDEFVMLLPHTDQEESQRICAEISSRYANVEGFPIEPSIAIGYSVQSQVMQDTQFTLKEAETNMYRHKLLDRNSIRSAILSSLDQTLSEKSYDTQAHAEGMLANSLMIGQHLKFSESELDKLLLLTRLHDIGKIAISDAILMKDGPLDLDEWIRMKKHTEIGYRIAMSVSDLEHIADDLLAHHERWDGTGYPHGLAGESIPYHSRIVAIVDAYDAMTRGRPYKAAMSHDDARAELIRCAGTQFDPDLVTVFLNVC